MYSSEITHVLMHLSRMRSEVEETMKVMKQTDHNKRNCKLFLDILVHVREETLEFWKASVELGIT